MSSSQPSDLNLHILESRGITWVNIDRPSDAELSWVEEHYGIHPMALQEGPGHGELSTIDDFDTYLAIDMFFPVFDREVRITLASEVSVFVGSDYLIMIHDGSLKVIAELFEGSASDEEKLSDTVQGSTGYLLYSIYTVLSSYCASVVVGLDRIVDDVETRVFDERARDLVKEISFVRRDVIADLRIMRHQSNVLDTLEHHKYDFLNVDSAMYFGEVADNARSLSAELDELKEVVEGLSDANSTLINHQTNRIIRILTIISAILLPLTAISSLYGMNVGLPLANTSYAFAAVIGVMVAIALLMLAFFRLHHWI